MIVGLLFIFIFFLLPKMWLSISMSKNDKEMIEMPFTAAEFGEILIQENNLLDVKIEETSLVDHYDLRDKTVRIQEGRLERKSLTSLSIVFKLKSHIQIIFLFLK